MRAARRTALALLLLAPPLAAQEAWRDQFFPYAYYRSIDGFWAAAHFGEYRGVPWLLQPEAVAGEVTLDAGASTAGSWEALLVARMPALWPGWRVTAELAALRDNRLGYYGAGNATAYAPESLSAARPYFYSVSRTYVGGRVTVERRIAGPLRALAGVTLARTSYRDLPGETVFGDERAAGRLGAVPFGDRVGHLGLVYDTRDNEADPHEGLMVEALYASGAGYARTTGSLRLYASPAERLVLAGRLAGERITGRTNVALEQTMETSDLPVVAVGGYFSLRGYQDGRFTGPGKLLAGLEARYGLLWAPPFFEVNLVAFYDGGRVFDRAGAFAVTTRGLHQAGGAELAARLGRGTILAFGYARGAEGGQVIFGSRWSF